MFSAFSSDPIFDGRSIESKPYAAALTLPPAQKCGNCKRDRKSVGYIGILSQVPASNADGMFSASHLPRYMAHVYGAKKMATGARSKKAASANDWHDSSVTIAAIKSGRFVVQFLQCLRCSGWPKILALNYPNRAYPSTRVWIGGPSLPIQKRRLSVIVRMGCEADDTRSSANLKCGNGPKNVNFAFATISRARNHKMQRAVGSLTGLERARSTHRLLSHQPHHPVFLPASRSCRLLAFQSTLAMRL
jgi:hypothetical protein